MKLSWKKRAESKETSSSERALRFRVLLLKLSLLLLFLLVVWRLIQIQIVEAPKYQEIARRQYEARVPLPAAKGNIFDRNGNILVSNSQFISYAVDPKVVGKEAGRVAEAFAQVFGKPKKHYMEKLKTDKRFVWLERRVMPEIGRRLREKDLPGVVSLNEAKRLYHYDKLAGQLLGFTDIDNVGLSGLELQFDKQMRGLDGYVVLQKDGMGNRRPSVDYPRVEPTPGANLHLTIDLGYQSILEAELEKGVQKSNAESGLAVMMNPKTGEILGLAQYPGINPNEVGRDDVESQRIRVVTDMFEPGSIFKVVTVSAALEGNLVSPHQRFFAENGKYEVHLRNGKIRLIRDVHDHGWLTFQEALEVSSNIVMAKVSDIIGPERLYRKAKEFGFGARTGIEVPGEILGELKKPSAWSATTLNTMAYGYEIGVTPIQLLAAYAAVANGGVLLRPFVVKKIVGPAGEILTASKPKIVRRVLSKQTSHTMRSLLEGVVERGTGTLAKIEGIQIAGKTGTSRKHFAGKYLTNSYTASFIGFFPVQDPQIICLVMIDNPRSGAYYGGQVAAPVFRAIAERIISTSMDIPRTAVKGLVAEQITPGSVLVPNVCSLKIDVARKLLEERKLAMEQVGEGEVVLKQSPEPGSKLTEGGLVTLFLTRRTTGAGDAAVETPDLRGLSLRRAMSRLTMDKLLAVVRGSGIVVDQSPAPGEKVKSGTKVFIYCEPKRSTTVALNEGDSDRR